MTKQEWQEFYQQDETDFYKYDPDTGLFTSKDITHINSLEFSRTAQEYKKNNGIYTKADPIVDEKEYREFWDEEKRRRRYGYTVGGITITGEHYGFLNFAQILKTDDPEDVSDLIKTSRDKKKNIAVKKEAGFPDFWDGHFKWFHAKAFARARGLHVIGGKARRKGFSYIGGWSAFDKYDLNPKMTIVIAAFDSKYLIVGDGTMAMCKSYMDFINLKTAWKKRRLINAKDEVISGYKLEGEAEARGFLSKVLALSCQNNPDAVVGKDAYEIQLEELGKFPNLSEVLDVTLPTLEDGEYITGQIVGWGTGGTKDGNWEAFEKHFYNPSASGFLACDNVFEEGKRGLMIGFWFPHYENLKGHMDVNGNSNKESAKFSSDAKRTWKKATVTDISDYLMYVGQRAYNPSEAFSRSVSNIFSSNELTAWKDYVERNDEIKYLHTDGQLVRTRDKGLQFIDNEVLKQIKPDLYHPAVVDYPHKKNSDVHGCFRIWTQPYKINGVIPKNLYRIWVDPVAIDKDKKTITTKNSLNCLYVYERTNIHTPGKGNKLVAMYVGRPEKLDDFNEVCLRAAEYYGNHEECIMFENNRGTLKQWAQRMKKTRLLAYAPDLVWKKEITRPEGNKDWGITIDDKKKGIGIKEFRDWLYEVVGVDHSGTEILNLHYIYDIGLLRELEKFNLLGNFDRISTMVVGMYDIGEEYHKEVTVFEKPDPNDFFNRSLF